jgi:hypothetical protein
MTPAPYAQPPLTLPESEIVASLDSAFQPYALEIRRQALAAGIPFTFTSGLRSYSDQAELYAHPELHPGTPAAAPGTSKHEVGFAFDFTGPRSDDEYERVAEIGEGMGLTWGGRWGGDQRDRVHFEAPTPRADLLTYRNIKIAAGAAAGAGLFFLSFVVAKHAGPAA